MTEGGLLAGALALLGDWAEDLPRLSKPHQTNTPISTHHNNLAIRFSFAAVDSAQMFWTLQDNFQHKT